MPAPADLLRETAARLRAEAARLDQQADQLDGAEPDELVEVAVASERSGLAPDTIRKRWYRDPTIGRKVRGRLLVSLARLTGRG